MQSRDREACEIFFQSLVMQDTLQEYRFLTGWFQAVVVYCRNRDAQEVVVKFYVDQFQSIEQEYTMYQNLYALDIQTPVCWYYSTDTFVPWMMISYISGKTLASFPIAEHDFVSIGRELGRLSHLSWSLYGKWIDGIYDTFRESFAWLYDDVILSDILAFADSLMTLWQLKNLIGMYISHIEHDLKWKQATLCHGDCSPDNIMLDQDRNIVFIDPQPIWSHYLYDMVFFIQRYMIQGEDWSLLESIIQKLLLWYQETCACECDKKSLYAILFIVNIRKMFVYHRHNPQREKKIKHLYAYMDNFTLQKFLWK